MPSSYPVPCPHENRGWTGSLVPSLVRGGTDAEVASTQRAWFCCPHGQRDGVCITDDRATILPAVEHGG